MSSTESTQSTVRNAPPVDKVRVGLIIANVWERLTDERVFYSVTFERRYRDANGEWQSAHTYDAGDLLALAKAADLAHTRILELLRGGEGA